MYFSFKFFSKQVGWLCSRQMAAHVQKYKIALTTVVGLWPVGVLSIVQGGHSTQKKTGLFLFLFHKYGICYILCDGLHPSSQALAYPWLIVSVKLGSERS